MSTQAHCRHRRAFGIDKGNFNAMRNALQQNTLVHSLVAEFRSDEEKTRLQDAETRRHGHSIEILDSESGDVLVFMFNGDLEKISIFTLQEEEESAL